MAGSPGAFAIKLITASLLASGLLMAPAAVRDLGAARAQGEQFRVNAGDVLAVTVFGRTDLSGEFPVAPDGTIALPLAGTIEAAGLAPATLSEQIEQALLQYIPGISVSVTTAKFAPVFVVGEVQSPGRYEYRPGMTALELFALAGGMRRGQPERDPSTLQIIQSRQDLVDTELQMFAQHVTRDRVRAELEDVDYAGAMPGDAGGVPGGEAEKRMIESQVTLFRIRKAAHEALEKGIVANAASYDEEIATLNRSIELHDQEIGLLEEDVAAQKSLVERGLTAKSSLREIERLLSSTRRDALELRSCLARARQNKLGIELRRTELAGLRRDEAAKQLQDIEVSLARLTVRRDGLSRTIGELARSSGSDVMAATEAQPSYRIMRLVDGGYRQVEATEQEPIRPNDILTVRLPDLRATAAIR